MDLRESTPVKTIILSRVNDQKLKIKEFKEKRKQKLVQNMVSNWH